jgi:hypothetical protein
MWKKMEKIRDTNYEEKYSVEVSDGRQDVENSLFILTYFLVSEGDFELNNHSFINLSEQIDSIKLQQYSVAGFKNDIILELQAIQDYELNSDCELKLQLICKNCGKSYCECDENKFKLINFCEFDEKKDRKEIMLPRSMKKGQVMKYKVHFDLTNKANIPEGMQNLGKFVITLKRFKNPDNKAIEL